MISIAAPCMLFGVLASHRPTEPLGLDRPRPGGHLLLGVFMNAWWMVGMITMIDFASTVVADDSSALPPAAGFQPASASDEARMRAKMLHELVRGSLQVMHRDFFDEDNARAIPSASLEDVFREMHRSYSVKMKWLTVDADVVNVDHQAETQFEKNAVEALAAGKPFAEEVTAEHYHFAGPIRLGSQCLKCHLKRRTSNHDRTSALVITLPLADKPLQKSEE